jgi:hypothetical protein
MQERLDWEQALAATFANFPDQQEFDIKSVRNSRAQGATWLTERWLIEHATDRCLAQQEDIGAVEELKLWTLYDWNPRFRELHNTLVQPSSHLVQTRAAQRAAGQHLQRGGSGRNALEQHNRQRRTDQILANRLQQLRVFLQLHLNIHDEVKAYEPVPIVGIQQRFNRLVDDLEAHPHHDQVLAENMATLQTLFQQHVDGINHTEERIAILTENIEERQRRLQDSVQRYAQLRFELFPPLSPLPE